MDDLASVREGRSMHRRRGPEHRGQGLRSGKRRLFDNAELLAMLLDLLGQKPRHGYELIRAIEARSAGAYVPSAGVIYPALARMEEAGLVVARRGQGRSRSYALTEAGDRKSREMAGTMNKAYARLDDLARERRRLDPIAVRRAFEALEESVKECLSSGNQDVLAIARAIDEATRMVKGLGS